MKDKVIDLQRRFDGKKVLLGIDRLDYVKGIPHKLKAVEKFLQMYPSMANKIVLVQIAVPSRVDVPGYQKLRSNVHRLVTRINGEFGSLEDVPIHYLDQPISFDELVALYFRADIMFVTSLRDGMNLVSFEFIACQEKNRGVLVLSEFAGAAQALGAGALLVNPYNTDEVAKALWEALNMKEDKRNERFSYMFDHINGHSAQAWADKFVSGLRHAAEAGEGAYDVGLFSGLEEARQLPKADVVASYKACERNGSQRLIVLGLLGTLIEYASFRSLQQLLPSVRRNLATLASSALNTVVVCSGRERALVNEWLGDLPIWLIAENGLYFRKGGADGTKDWESTKEDVTSDPDANVDGVAQAGLQVLRGADARHVHRGAGAHDHVALLRRDRARRVRRRRERRRAGGGAQLRHGRFAGAPGEGVEHGAEGDWTCGGSRCGRTASPRAPRSR